jgi:nucleotidyltransferase/DNA polymerase involved in DNA repair
MIAKIASKLNKPQAVTALSRCGLRRVSEYFNFRDIPGLGGDLGERVQNEFGQMTMAQLRRSVSGDFEDFIQILGEDDASEITRLVNAVCFEEVVHKVMYTGLNCGKNNLSEY